MWKSLGKFEGLKLLLKKGNVHLKYVYIYVYIWWSVSVYLSIYVLVVWMNLCGYNSHVCWQLSAVCLLAFSKGEQKQTLSCSLTWVRALVWDTGVLALVRDSLQSKLQGMVTWMVTLNGSWPSSRFQDQTHIPAVPTMLSMECLVIFRCSHGWSADALLF